MRPWGCAHVGGAARKAMWALSGADSFRVATTHCILAHADMHSGSTRALRSACQHVQGCIHRGSRGTCTPHDSLPNIYGPAHSLIIVFIPHTATEQAKAETVGLQQRLATANLAHAEIAMAAQLALDQVSDIQSCDLLSDQEKGRAVTGSTAAVPAGSPGSDEAARLVSVSQSEGGSAGAVSYKQKAALARQQMEKVRKLASDAVAAATAESASRRESTASAGRLSGSGFTSSVGGSASSAGGAVPLPQPVA